MASASSTSKTPVSTWALSGMVTLLAKEGTCTLMDPTSKDKFRTTSQKGMGFSLMRP